MNTDIVVLRGALQTHPALDALSLWKLERLLEYHARIVAWVPKYEKPWARVAGELERADREYKRLWDTEKRAWFGRQALSEQVKKAAAVVTGLRREAHARSEALWRARSSVDSSAKSIALMVTQIGRVDRPAWANPALPAALLAPPGSFLACIEPDEGFECADPKVPELIPYNVHWSGLSGAARFTMNKLIHGFGWDCKAFEIESAEALYSDCAQTYLKLLSAHLASPSGAAMADWNRCMGEPNAVKQRARDLERTIVSLFGP